MSDLEAHVDGLLHEPTQVHDGGVDLSVAAVYRVADPGRVDFGGGELDPAGLQDHGTAKRDAEDDYEWWTLSPGQYLIEYNERLSPPEGTRLVVQTRKAVRERGAFHPTLHTRDPGLVPLSVGGSGLKLKENARVSTVIATDG